MPDTPERNLSVSLRPQRFSEVIGYTDTIEQLKNQFTAGRVPTALKFVGVSRGGKTTLARIVAMSVNCTHGEFGEPCDACLENADFEINEMNAAAFGKAEDMRDLLNDLRWTPRAGFYRVFILDECQQMTTAAQNILLKPLEQADSCNIFIFCTTDPTKLIPALQKRCGSCQFTVDGLSASEIEQLINYASPFVAEGGFDQQTVLALTQLLVERSIFAPGDVVSAVERLSNGATLEAAAVSSDFSGKVDIKVLNAAVVRGDWDTCRKQLALAEPRDGDEIRVRLTAHLRYLLLDQGCQPVRADLLSQFIHELTDHDTPISGLVLSATVASVLKICNIVREAAARRAQFQRAA